MADVVESLNAFAKEKFGKNKPTNLIPEQNKLQKEIAFTEKKAYGLKYVEGIRLSYPSGFTHQAADGTGGAFALNDATASTRKRIEIQGEQILLKDQFSYEDAARIAQGGEQGMVTFIEETQEPMVRAMRKRLETQLIYGGASIGTVETYTSGDPSVVISLATWAEGIWAGMEGVAVEFRDTSSSNADLGTVTVNEIDLDNRKLTLSGTVTSLAAGDTIYWDGAYGEEMNGLHKILTNTGSLFGIDASTYTLWKGTSKALSSAPLSYEAIKKVIAQAYNRGLDDDISMMLSPEAWDDINTDISALKRTSSSEIAKVDIGHEEIMIHSQNGKTKLCASNFVKKGFAYGLCKKDWKRIGAADITNSLPGISEEKMFFSLEGKAGIESRMYTNQGIFCRRPAASFVVSGIVNRA